MLRDRNDTAIIFPLGIQNHRRADKTGLLSTPLDLLPTELDLILDPSVFRYSDILFLFRSTVPATKAKIYICTLPFEPEELQKISPLSCQNNATKKGTLPSCKW